ncbi:MAG: YjgN family protein [Ottowia sp.]|uniref:YjgN family protein n=1 Tax=Ottowia sp. TaxID=1898956 RepID=UPI0039E5ED03
MEHQPSPAVTPHPIEFTGSGGEYFRVWIVNLLLTIVTLSLYTPWARRRTAQYFYGHTQVVGSPLEFVAEQRRMVFGFLIFVALYAAYELAVQTGQDLAAALLIFGFALLTPFLWGSAMRFRLGATRWRGIRLAFTASWKEVYLASWPVFAIAAVWTGAAIATDALLPAQARTALALVLTLLCVIRLEFNYKRLLVARARIGGQAGRWKPAYGDFVKVWLAAAGIFVLTLLGVAVAGSVVTGGIVYLARDLMRGTSVPGMILLGVLFFAAAVLMLMLASLPARAYREARVFQLVWNNVGFGHIARTRTSLRTGAYVALRVKNVLLSLLTLGFYRPFAIASEYAAKAGSVTLHVKGSPEQLVGELARQQGAFGDAAADALGLDLIG